MTGGHGIGSMVWFGVLIFVVRCFPSPSDSCRERAERPFLVFQLAVLVERAGIVNLAPRPLDAGDHVSPGIGAPAAGHIEYPVHGGCPLGIADLDPFGGVQDSFQQIGPLARSVDDLGLLLQLIAGPDAADPGVFPLEWHEPEAVDLQALRISFHTDNGIATPTPETQRTVTEVVLRLEPIVMAVDDVKPAGVEQTMDLSGLYSWDGGAAVKRLLGEAGTTESPRLTQDNPALAAVELDALLARWYSFRSRMHSFMADYDVIVSPANAGPAPVHGPEMEEFSRFTYTFTYNLTGWPAAVVRAGTSPEGLPIGVQIVARPGREDVALAVAKFVETEFGGFQRSGL